jgi:flavin reductase (DIM6/NTAB) family NADH-FMN oxidoreductase RutF
VSGELYKSLGRSAAGAVSIVTARSAQTGVIVGLTVSSFVTLSFEPPIVMFALQHNADSYPSMAASKSFGVSLLAADQAAIAQLFASKGPEKSKVTNFEWGTELKVPLIPGALAQIECATIEVVKSGDHAIIMGQVEHARTRPGEPLLYYARRYGTFTALGEDSR